MINHDCPKYDFLNSETKSAFKSSFISDLYKIRFGIIFFHNLKDEKTENWFAL